MHYLPVAVPSTVDTFTCGTNSPALALIKEIPRFTDPALSLTLYTVGSNPNVNTEKGMLKFLTIAFYSLVKSEEINAVPIMHAIF